VHATEKGHRQGDPECPKKKAATGDAGSSPTTGKQPFKYRGRVGFLAITDQPEESPETEVVTKPIEDAKIVAEPLDDTDPGAQSTDAADTGARSTGDVMAAHPFLLRGERGRKTVFVVDDCEDDDDDEEEPCAM